MTPSYPPLAYPFPRAINPHSETIDRVSIDWVQRHGLMHDAADVEQLRRQRPGILIGYAFPHAPLEALQWISDWMTWLFVFDDLWDETEQGRAPEQLAKLRAAWLTMFDGSAPTLDDPLSRAWYDLATRLRAQSDPDWRERFVQCLSDYFTGCMWEASNRAEQQMPDLATYLRMRHYTGGMYFFVSLIEFANNINLPAAVHAHPTVQGLALNTINITCWCNDILSLEKELRHGDVHNLAIVLQHAQQCSFAEALDRAVAMHDAEVQCFQALAAQLPSFGPAVDAELQQYVMGMQYWICANLDWSLDSIRYRPFAVEDLDLVEAIPD